MYLPGPGLLQDITMSSRVIYADTNGWISFFLKLSSIQSS